MTRHSIRVWPLLALLIVVVGVSTSQAQCWTGYYYPTYYYYPSCCSGMVSTQPAATTATSTAGQPIVATAGPTVYTAAKPVTTENAVPMAAPVPQSGYYAPASGYSSGGFSVTPRSSWDFGKFPPYSH